jgi:hypothetical protein
MILFLILVSSRDKKAGQNRCGGAFFIPCTKKSPALKAGGSKTVYRRLIIGCCCDYIKYIIGFEPFETLLDKLTEKILRFEAEGTVAGGDY